jgi:hypothetical protein
MQGARCSGRCCILHGCSFAMGPAAGAANAAAAAAAGWANGFVLTDSRCQMLMWQAAPSVHTATRLPQGDTARHVAPMSAGTWKLPVRVVLLLSAANTCSSGLRPCSTRARCPEAALAAMAATPCRGASIRRCDRATPRVTQGDSGKEGREGRRATYLLLLLWVVHHHDAPGCPCHIPASETHHPCASVTTHPPAGEHHGVMR